MKDWFYFDDFVFEQYKTTGNTNYFLDGDIGTFENNITGITSDVIDIIDTIDVIGIVGTIAVIGIVGTIGVACIVHSIDVML